MFLFNVNGWLYVVVRTVRNLPGAANHSGRLCSFLSNMSDLLQQTPYVGEMSFSISLTFYLMLTAQDRRHLHFLKVLGTHFFCEFKIIIQYLCQNSFTNSLVSWSAVRGCLKKIQISLLRRVLVKGGLIGRSTFSLTGFLFKPTFGNKFKFMIYILLFYRLFIYKHFFFNQKVIISYLFVHFVLISNKFSSVRNIFFLNKCWLTFLKIRCPHNSYVVELIAEWDWNMM